MAHEWFSSFRLALETCSTSRLPAFIPTALISPARAIRLSIAQSNAMAELSDQSSPGPNQPRKTSNSEQSIGRGRQSAAAGKAGRIRIRHNGQIYELREKPVLEN